MQIVDFEIKNYKNIGNLSLRTAPINIFIGENGAGKSSVLSAIRYGICGKTAKNITPIDDPFAQTEVSVNVDGIGKIRRRAFDRLTVAGKTTTGKSLNEMYVAQFGCSPETLNLLTSRESIVDYLGEDLSKYMLSEGFLKNDMTIDEMIRLYNGAAFPAPISADEEAELRSFFPAAPAVITMEDLADAYKHYYDSRAGIKANIEAQKSRSEYAGIVPTRTLKEVEDMIAEKQKEIGVLDATIKNYANILESRNRSEKGIKESEEYIAAHAVAKPTVAEKQANSTAIKTNADFIARNVKAMAEVKAQISSLQEILKKLDEPVCPISGLLVCTTDKTPVKQDLMDVVSTNQKSLDDMIAEEKRFLEEKTKLENERKKLEERSREHELCQMHKMQVEKLKRSMPALIEKPDSSERGAIEAQINALNVERNSILLYEKTKKEEAQLLFYKQQLDVYNGIVALLSPKGGIRKLVLEHYLAPLEDYMNESLDVLLPNYKVKFDMQGGFNMFFEQKAKPGQTIPFTALSSGEKARVMFAMTDMLNALNQFRILMLDGLDALDAEGISATLKLVETSVADGKYDQVFVSVLNTKENMKLVNNLGKTAKTGMVNVVEMPLPF